MPGLLLLLRPIPPPMLAEMPGLLFQRPMPAPRLAEMPGLPWLLRPTPPPIFPFCQKLPKVLPRLAGMSICFPRLERGRVLSQTVWKVVTHSWLTQEEVVMHSLSTMVWHFSSSTVSYSVVH